MVKLAAAQRWDNRFPIPTQEVSNALVTPLECSWATMNIFYDSFLHDHIELAEALLSRDNETERVLSLLRPCSVCWKGRHRRQDYGSW
ncbi:hypothetical protein EVAR_102178_1 [Eumeta japonica]|uniref:Uncharacterized protein n=1 Tax=Eumeta variegata TaxID=151549 RepID=A0A4C1ZGA8_EUMVA|nr:hypothetical protein EVAR_102178_1 [Eumeta japonica]